MLRADAPATQPATTNFTDKANGFSIDYPADWKKPKLKQGTTVRVVVRPTADKLLRLQIDVKPTDLKPENLKKVTDFTISMVKDDGKVIADDATTLDGVASRTIDYTKPGEQAGTEIGVLQIVCIKDGQFYTIEYTGPAEGFAKFKEQAQSIVKSFKWLAAGN